MDKKQTEALRIATESLPMLKIAASLGDETGQISFHSSHLLNLIEGYAAARQEIESLKAKNLELERVCDATYVTQGADAYNHACSMMEQYQAERKAARKEVGTEGSLCDGISWLYERIASLESQLEAVGTGGWMRNGALLYRLTDECRPTNFDEIRVTMANGSRDIGQTSSLAERLLVMLSAPQPTPQALGAAGGDVQPYDQREMGLCHVCGWKGVIDYPDGPVCVACEHDKTLSPQPTAQPLHVAATSCPHEIDKDKIVLHFDSKQPGKNALAQLAARLQAAQAQEDVPDMFWDADDTETFAHEIQDIIDVYGPGEIVTIECAKRLPNFRAVVTRDGDGISYEYLEAAIAAQEGNHD